MSLGRIRHDTALICAAHTTLAADVDEDRGTAHITGTLLVELPDGTADPVAIRMVFGRAHPNQRPIVYDANGRWPVDPDRHIIQGGAFCLSLPGVDDPDLDTDEQVLAFVEDIRTFLRQQIILDSQLRFDTSARFPGPEWPHGAATAYKLFCLRLLADHPETTRRPLWDAARGATHPPKCPCGSGQPKPHCCGPTLKQLTRAAYEADLYHVTYEALQATTNAAR